MKLEDAISSITGSRKFENIPSSIIISFKSMLTAENLWRVTLIQRVAATVKYKIWNASEPQRHKNRIYSRSPMQMHHIPVGS